MKRGERIGEAAYEFYRTDKIGAAGGSGYRPLYYGAPGWKFRRSAESGRSLARLLSPVGYARWSSRLVRPLTPSGGVGNRRRVRRFDGTARGYGGACDGHGALALSGAIAGEALDGAGEPRRIRGRPSRYAVSPPLRPHHAHRRPAAAGRGKRRAYAVHRLSSCAPGVSDAPRPYPAGDG